MLGRVRTSATSHWSKVSELPLYQLSIQELAGQRGSRRVAPAVIPALVPTLDKSLKVTGPYIQSEPCATTWVGPSGRQRSWSPSRKVFDKMSPLPLSPHGFQPAIGNDITPLHSLI